LKVEKEFYTTYFKRIPHNLQTFRMLPDNKCMHLLGKYYSLVVTSHHSP